MGSQRGPKAAGRVPWRAPTCLARTDVLVLITKENRRIRGDLGTGPVQKGLNRAVQGANRLRTAGEPARAARAAPLPRPRTNVAVPRVPAGFLPPRGRGRARAWSTWPAAGQRMADAWPARRIPHASPRGDPRQRLVANGGMAHGRRASAPLARAHGDPRVGQPANGRPTRVCLCLILHGPHAW